MNKERIEEIRAEGERRINLWLENSSFEDMTANNSFIRFNMSLALNGYPFKKPEWMGGDFDTFVTEEEFHSDEYDNITKSLFEKHAGFELEDYSVSVQTF